MKKWLEDAANRTGPDRSGGMVKELMNGMEWKFWEEEELLYSVYRSNLGANMLHFARSGTETGDLGRHISWHHSTRLAIIQLKETQTPGY